MRRTIKDNWKFLLLVLLGGLIGGYCTGLYVVDTYPTETLQQMQSQGVTREALALSGAIQYGVLYGVILAVPGVILSKKLGLWREFRFDARAARAAAAVTLIAGLILFPGDRLIFGPLNSWVAEQYTAPPGLAKILAGLLVGGIIEEVMMRLFLMTLLAWVSARLFCRGKDPVPEAVFVIANIVSALAFAAGHLPGTAAMTTLTPVILFRCFLFNGGLGLCFGRLYRKYGIGYAMLAHGLAHLLADMLMAALL